MLSDRSLPGETCATHFVSLTHPVTCFRHLLFQIPELLSLSLTGSVIIWGNMAERHDNNGKTVETKREDVKIFPGN